MCWFDDWLTIGVQFGVASFRCMPLDSSDFPLAGPALPTGLVETHSLERCHIWTVRVAWWRLCAASLSAPFAVFLSPNRFGRQFQCIQSVYNTVLCSLPLHCSFPEGSNNSTLSHTVSRFDSHCIVIGRTPTLRIFTACKMFNLPPPQTFYSPPTRAEGKNYCSSCPDCSLPSWRGQGEFYRHFPFLFSWPLLLLYR